ncbi:MAG: 4-phosphoerythronate dehydrogenase [Nannocystaceae bacterium]|nr:4-phosphoerythronate dehydrogenase [bacterium]
MTPLRIVADDAIPHLSEAFGEVTRVRGAEITREHLLDADALLVRSVTRVDAALVEDTPLRFVGSATAGIDHVDTDALRAGGIAFAHAPGCNARAVVEYVLAATLGWSELRGPVGVVGHGQIGRRLTAALRRLGLEVWVCDPPRAEAGDGQERYVELNVLLERCHTVTLHVPRSRGPHGTHHLIDEAALARLAPGSRVINTSRGDVVDNVALHRWLDAGRGDAVLDVWEGEPALRWELLAHPGVILATPHIAGYTAEGKARGTAMVHAAMTRIFDDLPRFDPARVLPPRVAPPEATPEATLRALHPLRETDASLRALARRPEASRPGAFESLRRGYRLRREVPHDAAGPLADALRWADDALVPSAPGYDR